MRRFAVFVLMTACGMPAGLDTVRNNPIDPQADPAQQRCGNGIINSGEECDDGNIVATDACTDTCKLARCDDGHTRTDLGSNEDDFESCDDGDANSNAGACLENCIVARCGDGEVRADLAEADEGFESCDDGNTVDTDDCTNGCLQARCGDGILRTNDDESPSSFAPCANGGVCGEGELCTNERCVNPNYEVCDDGNSVNDDGCTNTCQVGRCGDGVIQLGEECDAGEAPNEYCIECALKRCDSGCFDALDPDSTDHCVRVPVPGGQYVNACLPAQGAPNTVPAPLGVCRSGDDDFDTRSPCARDTDCEDESSTCDIRPAWHRCVTSEPNRLHGFLKSCIPGEGHCSEEGLLCSSMVAKRWHGFCDAGESPDGWHLTGYQTQIPGRDDVICYPSACEGVAVDDSADQPTNAQSNACPHLNGFNGQSTQNTYCAAGSDFTQAQLTSCLWEECRANADDEADSVAACDHHQVVDTGPARCTGAEVCGYTPDDAQAPAQLYPLDLTHPFNLISFTDRCDSACMWRGAACAAVHDGLSPVAQAQCMVCDSDDCCPEGTARVAPGREDNLDELAGLCLRPCIVDRDCGSGFECGSNDGQSGFCMAQVAEGQEFDVGGRTVPTSCQTDADCPESLCLPMVTSNPDSLKVCQLKPCRYEWDCPMTQNCGGGRCRQDILCGWPNRCDSGAVCSQTQLNRGLYGPVCANDLDCETEGSEGWEVCQFGVCGHACDSNEDCDDHLPCLNGLCLLDRDFGTCRLPSSGLTDDAGGSIQIELQNMRGFSEGFMLEGGSYRDLSIVTPSSGLLGLEGFSRQDIRCRFMLEGDQMQPVDIAERFSLDENLCAGWYEIQAGQEYTLRIQSNDASNIMWRPPTHVFLEGQFVQDQTITDSCTGSGESELQPWEGCVDPDPNELDDGCVDCRCTEPQLQTTRDRLLANYWHLQDTSFLGCHHGHTDHIIQGFDYPFAAEEGPMVFVADSVNFQAEHTWIDCMVIRRWTEDGEDREEHLGKDEELSSLNACVVVFEPERGDQVDFHARWDGEPPPGPIPVRYTTGIQCSAQDGEPCQGVCRSFGQVSVCEALRPAP